MDITRIIPRPRPGGLFGKNFIVEEWVDSTNTRLKELAAAGAPHGTVFAADGQREGRGTGGRSFVSPAGQGVYLSVLLRPEHVSPSQLLTLTGWTAVAARRGVRRACGVWVDIKWLNDLYLGGKKLCGILTELSTAGGQAEWVVIGIGVNVSQTYEELSAQGLGEIATSLAAEGYPVEREALAACLLEELERMYTDFPHRHGDYLAEYRTACMTVGRRVSFQEGGRTCRGAALDIAGDYTLTVGGEDGRSRQISAGMVSLL